MRVETLALLASLYFSLAFNGLFWQSSLSDRSLAQPDTWLLVGSLFMTITAIHFILLALVLNRWTAKWLLGVLLVGTAFATYYMRTFTVFLDPSMLRNVLRTDFKEASELFTFGMLPVLLLLGGVPLLFVARVRLRIDGWRRSLLIRALTLVIALVAAAGALMAGFQQIAPLMRNHKEVRYLITPANYLYSLARVLGTDANAATQPRVQIGLDAKLGNSWQQRKKPALFVIVVGETARAANWGLSGYARQTTPELAKLDVINFTDVKSCGTNTEVSVPCLFSVFGRRHYDEDKIRGTESLLNVLTHAGLKVLWRDNQSGCKGVCEGVAEEKLSNSEVPEFCDGDRCLDEILLHGLDTILADNTGNRVLVLHQLGSHGPAYFKRYPPEFGQFKPTCDTSEIAKCSREEVVNAYDNAVLYTDHMLAKTISFLKSQEKIYDSAMIYISDHGESIGENGLYLHGLPYSIAPNEQTQVPMLMWISPGYAKDFGIDTDCLRQRATQPASHDNIFHSVLGLLDVKTGEYDAPMDFTAKCRQP